MIRPTVAEIDLKAIAFNIEQVKQRVHPARVMAVVKANAYGHGSVRVARHALESGADYLGVAIPEEGMELREAGITAPILVFGSPLPDSLEHYFNNDLACTICNWDQAEAVSHLGARLGKRIPCHVKVDTGMGRVGIHHREALSFIQRIMSELDILLEGVYTHFATSDMQDKSYADLQLGRFQTVVSILEKAGIRIPIVHAANSGAILDMPESTFDMVRPGVMMYGYYPSFETTESLTLKPAMRFRTRVAFVKRVPEATGISYGKTYIAEPHRCIATLPLGYADGYNRLLSNKGKVLIQGREYPVVGRVCMDMIMVDLGPDTNVIAGDEAVLFGKQDDLEISVYDLCRQLNTIPYEVTCRVSERVPRSYMD